MLLKYVFNSWIFMKKYTVFSIYYWWLANKPVDIFAIFLLVHIKCVAKQIISPLLSTHTLVFVIHSFEGTSEPNDVLNPSVTEQLKEEGFTSSEHRFGSATMIQNLSQRRRRYFKLHCVISLLSLKSYPARHCPDHFEIHQGGNWSVSGAALLSPVWIPR